MFRRSVAAAKATPAPGVSWEEIQKMRPEFATAVLACAHCANDTLMFDEESGQLIVALQRSIRRCPQELLDQFPLAAPVGTASSLWLFLDQLSSRRPIYREQIRAVRLALEASGEWLRLRPPQVGFVGQDSSTGMAPALLETIFRAKVKTAAKPKAEAKVKTENDVSTTTHNFDKGSWEEFQELCPDFAAAVVACARCANDSVTFDDESGQQIVALQRSIRRCPRDLLERLPSVAPIATTVAVWVFLDQLCSIRPVYKEHARGVTSVLEASDPWLRVRPPQALQLG